MNEGTRRQISRQDGPGNSTEERRGTQEREVGASGHPACGHPAPQVYPWPLALPCLGLTMSCPHTHLSEPFSLSTWVPGTSAGVGSPIPSLEHPGNPALPLGSHVPPPASICHSLKRWCINTSQIQLGPAPRCSPSSVQCNPHIQGTTPSGTCSPSPFSF